MKENPQKKKMRKKEKEDEKEAELPSVLRFVVDVFIAATTAGVRPQHRCDVSVCTLPPVCMCGVCVVHVVPVYILMRNK